METKLSTKGQIVLPGPIRRKLGLRAGDRLIAKVEAGKIILTPDYKPAIHAKVIKDPLTGFPVIDLGPDPPILTHEQVKELLSDFP
jgi:AbrB family looped-hinge helix DNA binding protein